MKKLLTLFLLTTILCACGTEKADPKTELVNAWNSAAENGLEKTAIAFSEDTGSTILFHIYEDAVIDEKASKCESDTEYAEKIKAANAEFNAAAVDFLTNVTLEEIEDGEKLFSPLKYKFEVKDSEKLIDPEGIAFIFYEDLHVEVTYKEEVSYYAISEEDFASLKALSDTYLEILLGQPEACVVQDFVK